MADLQPRVPQLRHPLRADLGPRPGARAHAGLRGHARPHAPPARRGRRRCRCPGSGEDGGYTAMLALAMLAFGALVWGVFLLGPRVVRLAAPARWPHSWWRRATRSSRRPCAHMSTSRSWRWSSRAAVLEVRRPRRGPAGAGAARAGGPAAPGGVAAGRRLLAVRRAASCRAPRALRLAALAAAPPVLWALSDLAVTGDPLHSLTFTRDTAETLGRPQGIENVPEIMPRRLGEILRWVPLVGGTAGFFLALRYRARARAGARGAGRARRPRVRGDRDRRPVAARALPVPAGRDARDLLRLRGARLDRDCRATACAACGSGAPRCC